MPVHSPSGAPYMSSLSDFSSTTVIIEAAASKSAGKDIGAGKMITHIIAPGVIAGTSLQFEVSPDGVTYTPLYDKTGAALVKPTIAASHAIAVPDELVGARYIKIETYTAAVAQAQAADITITLMLADV